MKPQKKVHCFVMFVATIMFFVVVYAVTTSESLMGRRFAKVAAYRWDFRYWPNWYSAILWSLSFGFLSAVLVCREPFRGVVVRILQRVIPKKIVEAPKKHCFYFVSFFYALLIGIILFCLFVDFKPIRSFFQDKIYADSLLNPILLLETGSFSVKPPIWPFLLSLIFLIFYYLVKKGGKKYHLIFPCICPLLGAYTSATESSDKHTESLKKIRLIQSAEYKIYFTMPVRYPFQTFENLMSSST
jgi:hypothetical protein